ncbi:MAG TPA: SGNH/GDSL hydrolase family protein, partial [Planctomycetota bacterium]|nr:SGNH/GDSL hydrolase family protein [Planctomycetota bacterium]
PGLDVEFQGVRVVTNADGFRGPRRSREKPANGYRIVGLGDSVLFGWGVPYEASGLAVLEARLQAACPTRLVEAVDTAVPGYNTAMEEQVLVDKGLAFAPDLVIVDFVGNDLDLPNYLWQQPDYLALDRSFLWNAVRRGLSWKDAELHGPFVWAPVGEDGAFESHADRVPEAYRHLVGPEAYRRALRSIAALGAEHGFHVLVTCHHDLWPEVRAICDEVGVPFLQMGKRVNTWLREHGHEALLGSPLTINPEDPHPSALLHGWWAEEVFLRLQELGWLPEATPR